MSLFTDGMTKVFPLQWIKECVEIYTKDNGKAPKLLVVSKEDFLDYSMNCTIHDAKKLNLEVTYSDYLKSGQIDLAMGIKK